MTQKVTMYVGSMDHSPSEQLGDPDRWHTTVLILSETASQSQLATELLESANGVPKKWSKSSQIHKDQFESVLAARLGGLHVRAISAQGKTIESSFEHMISELGLGNLTQPIVKNEKPYMEFGPFTRVTFDGDGQAKVNAEPAIFSLARNQAIPLIFICHFLLRTHQKVLTLVRNANKALEWIDWQLMPNKFPRDLKGPMASHFHAIMSGVGRQRLADGNIRVATFNETKADLGSILADNIAGLLADKLRKKDLTGHWQPDSAQGGMDWEIWQVELLTDDRPIEIRGS